MALGAASPAGFPNWFEAEVGLAGRERPHPRAVTASDTSVAGLTGCAAGDPCELGWPVNDIRAVANKEFLEANPPVRRLLEVVEIPLQDIAEQNSRMAMEAEYTDSQIRADAAAWIEDNRALVDGWLEIARG